MWRAAEASRPAVATPTIRRVYPRRSGFWAGLERASRQSTGRAIYMELSPDQALLPSPCMHSIFLDHCTTTPIAASVRESMLPFLQNLYGHPACTHWMGRAAAAAIEGARSHLASLLECHPIEIIFTSVAPRASTWGCSGCHGRSSQCQLAALHHQQPGACGRQGHGLAITARLAGHHDRL